MSTNEISVTKVPAWKEAGLPGCPVFLTPSHKVYFVPLDALVTDDTGKIITASSNSGLHSILSEALGKSIEAVKLAPEMEGGALGTVGGRYLDTVAFRYTGISRLSLLERHTAGVLARMARNYYPPMKRRDRTVFPTALSDLPKELQSPRLKTQMWKAFTEDKAIQVASVLESMWSDIRTMVFEDGDGWFVAIDSGENEIEDVATLEHVETVLWMLSNFDAVPNEASLKCCEASLCGDEIAAVREHLDAKAVRAFEAYNAQRRIESALGEILSRLDPNAATGTETPSTATARTKGRGLDALIQPAGKKSSPKKSA